MVVRECEFCSQIAASRVNLHVILCDRANLITQAQKQCPSSKVIMSGYSQGGQLVHNAAKLLPQSTMSNLSSIVIFGDPCMPTIPFLCCR